MATASINPTAFRICAASTPRNRLNCLGMEFFASLLLRLPGAPVRHNFFQCLLKPIDPAARTESGSLATSELPNLGPGENTKTSEASSGKDLWNPPNPTLEVCLENVFVLAEAFVLTECNQMRRTMSIGLSHPHFVASQ